MEWAREIGPATADEEVPVELRRVAGGLALYLRPGDVVALSGDLGAGKTTFARALIRALLGRDEEEVASPTFPILIGYTAPRMAIAHYDLYRIEAPEALDELGFEEQAECGLVLVEWPERAGARLPADRFDVTLSELAGKPGRRLAISAAGERALRLARFAAFLAFVERMPAPWREARIAYLQGDASARRYARLTSSAGSALVMDAPRQPDGPVIRNGLPYSRIAHLAEDVRPFVALAKALGKAGLSTPAILAQDLERGFLLIEDLGDRVFGTLVAAGADQEELWRAGVDALLHLARTPPPATLPVDGAGLHALPAYDARAMAIETELLVDWLWPLLFGSPAPMDVALSFRAAWEPVIDRLAADTSAFVLRDYHSPNLIWLPERSGIARVGVIDFQDAMRGPAAYDLVSLLQDARLDVPEAIEQRLLNHYVAAQQARDIAFDEAWFRWSYAALGAQRNTKILGIFARLWKRDGKPQYLRHMPRIWGYLARDLNHPGLAALKLWYDQNLPQAVRRGIEAPH